MKAEAQHLPLAFFFIYKNYVFRGFIRHRYTRLLVIFVFANQELPVPRLLDNTATVMQDRWPKRRIKDKITETTTRATSRQHYILT